MGTMGTMEVTYNQLNLVPSFPQTPSALEIQTYGVSCSQGIGENVLHKALEMSKVKKEKGVGRWG